jgi:hypothetical protein
MPRPSAIPAYPSQRASGSTTDTPGSIASPVPTDPAGTSSPSPTTKEKAPETGWESAETTR